MAIFAWLEVNLYTKEEWKFAAMEYGGLFGLVAGTVLMLKLFARNWDCTKHTPVCMILSALFIIITV